MVIKSPSSTFLGCSIVHVTIILFALVGYRVIITLSSGIAAYLLSKMENLVAKIYFSPML